MMCRRRSHSEPCMNYKETARFPNDKNTKQCDENKADNWGDHGQEGCDD